MKRYLFLALLLLCGAGLHPIHISLTNIDFSAENKSLEMTHRFFVDDFEKMLEKETGWKLRLGTEQEYPKADSLIAAHLMQNFTIIVNGKPVERLFVGKEVEGEAIWIYIEAPEVKKLKTVEVAHLSLLDTFDDQRNFVNITYEGTKKAVILNAEVPRGIVSFKGK